MLTVPMKFQSHVTNEFGFHGCKTVKFYKSEVYNGSGDSHISFCDVCRTNFLAKLFTYEGANSFFIFCIALIASENVGRVKQ